MKTFMLFLLCSLTTGIVSAQTQKGKILLGASTNFSLLGGGSGTEYLSLGFSSIKYDNIGDDADNLISLNLFPKIGYFIMDNLAVGLDLNVAMASQKDGSDDSKYVNTMLGAGPFARYYFGSSKVRPFIELNSLFGSVQTKFEGVDLDLEYSTKLTSFGGGFGVAIPIGDKFCFDILLGYNNVTINESEDSGFISSDAKVNNIGLKLGFTALLGGGSGDTK